MRAEWVTLLQRCPLTAAHPCSLASTSSVLVFASKLWLKQFFKQVESNACGSGANCPPPTHPPCNPEGQSGRGMDKMVKCTKTSARALRKPRVFEH
jgi:hypothetical protein